MLSTDWKNQVHNLICTGNTRGDRKIEIDEKETALAIAILQHAATVAPEFLLESILTALNGEVAGMTTISLVALFSKADAKFFKQENNRSILFNILLAYDAYNLLQLVKMLKQKSFGRGLGSRSQKMIRKVMESWTTENLKTFIILQPTYVYGLLRLIHPRYRGERATLVKDLLDNN